MTRSGKNKIKKIEIPVCPNYFGKTFFFSLILLPTLFFAQISPNTSWASFDSPNNSSDTASKNQSKHSKPWYEKIESEWGGHVKVRGYVSWYDDESVFQLVGTDPYYDGYVEGRLKSKFYFGKWGYFNVHYEAILSGGDTRSKTKDLERLFPDLYEETWVFGGPVEDDRRLMDLTSTIDEGDGYILYNRLDRLSLTLLPKWGVVCIGRQAVTWGDGLIFNPMDLFNPYSPVDFERDYKIGDDMVSTQFSVDNIGDFQFLYVPRRDEISGDVNWDQSSLAGKLHFAKGTTEFDVMAAKHYKEAVLGIGSVGYLGDTVWRMDATWTFLNEDKSKDGYMSLVANVDYSWVWWEKNFYGFIEFYYNGLGDDNYTEAYADPDILERLERGEIFALGRTYLSGYIRVELNPLLNAYLTVINNLADPSGILQPRVIWDITEDIQITLGGNICYGRRNTEYGGFKYPDSDFFNEAPGSAYLWLTYFF